MPSLYHCVVKKPFDRYDNEGAIAVLSEGGYGRLQNSSKGQFRGHVELLCIEHSNGDVTDADNNVVLSSKERKGAPIDAFAIAEKIKGGGVEGELPNREEKKSKTR